MLFRRYRSLNRRDRALLDGKLITYHFYVGGATLLLLGYLGVSQGYLFSVVTALLGAGSLVLGAALNLMHHAFLRGPGRDSYLATLSAIMGRYSFPLLPVLFCTVVTFSLFATVLYVLTA